MIVEFRISSAGIGGDPDKLLFGKTVTPSGQVIEESVMFDNFGWGSCRRYRKAQKKIINKIKLRVQEI